jgi:hypothetical protein
MEMDMKKNHLLDIFLEVGKKKTFAGAVDFPGWCRWGKDEDQALETLIEYAPRYARALEGSGVEFLPPAVRKDLVVVERHPGNATTDFGATDAVLDSDSAAISPAERDRFEKILIAGWKTFDQAAALAEGKELRRGPRGGGRDREKIIRHVLDADHAYLRRLAWKYKQDPDALLQDELDRMREAILEAVAAGARGEIPEKGPRGGKIWPVRFFIRRLAWHTFDHAWEIEDRVP